MNEFVNTMAGRIHQYYTFAQTLIVLEPNSATPTGPWTEGDVDNVLIGIENHDDFTQANIDSGRVAYSVGIIYGMSSQKGFSRRVIKMLYSNLFR